MFTTTPSRPSGSGTPFSRPRPSRSALAPSPAPSDTPSHLSSKRRPKQSSVAPPSIAPSVADSNIDMPPTASSSYEDGATLLRDDLMAVTAYSRLPSEVLDQLEHIDFYTHPSHGALDPLTGFAYVASPTAAHVWSYTSRAAPTCFSFPAEDLPLCGLVPRSAAREPSLVLVTPAGHVSFYESLSASADHAHLLQAPLTSAETVTQMERLDPSTFILATSKARMLRLSIPTRSGRMQPELAPFSQPKGILGRIFGSGAAMGFSNEPIVAIAPGPERSDDAARDVFAIGSSTVQKWRIVQGAPERLIAEHDVRQIIASTVLQSADERFSAAQSLAFQILHGAVRSDHRLVLLYSHAKSPSQPLSYGLATVELLQDASSFVVSRIDPLKYTSFNDPRPFASPRLVLSFGGPAAFIVFADAIVLRVLEDECDSFEEPIKLRDAAHDRFIGTGSDPAELSGAEAAPVATLSLLTAASGSLLIELGVPQVRSLCVRQALPAERQAAKTDRLRVRIEQALYYANASSNPLSLALPAEFDGDLISAAEQLSGQILTSTNPSAAAVQAVDLRVILRDRLEKLSQLIRFIADSGHLGKLSQTSRRRLRADAELASAANDLWLYLNEYMSHARGGPGPLADSVERVMAESGFGFADDAVRVFFRHHVPRIGAVFEHLLKRVRAASAETLAVRSTETLETNRVTLAAFHAAQRYRKASGAVYGVSDGAGGYEGWTGKAGSIELLETLFGLTQALLSDRTRELGSAVDSLPAESGEQRVQAEMKTQLCGLAEHTLAAYEERLVFLRACGDERERETATVEAVYARVRPSLIHPLVAIGRIDRAFALAERHADFATLTQLCLGSGGGGEARIEHYLDVYGAPFAFELYSAYLSTDPHVLLSQKEAYDDLVAAFLSEGGHDRLAWLHELRRGQYDGASGTLLRVAEGEPRVSERRTALSLAKLAHVATLTIDDLATVGQQRHIEGIDDALDLLAVHARLAHTISDADSDAPQAERERERKLQDGYVLGSEDLIDLLTTRDMDFATALEVVIRANGLPAARVEAALRDTWRRAILHDDWTELSDTTNLSDESVLARLRQTALFALFERAFSHEGQHDTLRALETLLEPTSRDLLAARFDDTQLSLPVPVEDLYAQSEAECEAVRALMDDTDLPRLYAQVASLARG